MIRTTLTESAIDAASLLEEVTSDATGATTLFLGTVRDVNDGRAVTGIEYTAYTEMAADELQRIAEEALARFEGVRIVIEHRVGALGLREISVAIAVAHARRAPALDTSRFIIEALKQRVPIWKREQYVDGELQWVDPTAQAARAAAP
jgi:molybdopterin synthase catalytic subunit